ncbi:MAG: TolC family protein [Bacteroidales bacterium]
MKTRSIYLTGLLMIIFTVLQGQEMQETQLDMYIRAGLENNLALKQKESDWKEASLMLKEAKGLFYPDLSLNARYSVADGGRTIDFPVGDLLNPVYSTLNVLTSSNNFPSIENEEFPFLRPTEHETKLRLVQPLLNTDIFYNRKIQENNLEIEYGDLKSYKRSLVFEIKQAYYNYIKAIELLHLIENTMPVLEENLRVNQRLYDNDKVTRDVVLRSESEIRKMQENLEAARGSVEVSEAYFNFLLNRELNETIVPEISEIPAMPMDVEPYLERAVNSREEIIQLEEFSELAENNLKLNKASRAPELFAVVDYGFQGEKYRFTSDDDFVIASLVFKWDLFKGLQERSKVSKAAIASEKVNYKLQETEKLIRLDVLKTWYDLIASWKKLQASESNSEASSEAFRIIAKKYGQSQASLLEFMDARNNMTRSEQDVIINTYDLLIKYASFEKAAALYEFENE